MARIEEVTQFRFSVLMRLNVMGLLNTKHKGDPGDFKWQTGKVELYRKIEVPDEVIEGQYQIMIRDSTGSVTGILNDEKAIREAPEVTIGLNRAEYSALRAVMESVTDLKPVDWVRWYEPLAKQIEKAQFHSLVEDAVEMPEMPATAEN